VTCFAAFVPSLGVPPDHGSTMRRKTARQPALA
jgi:hypothetical protein